MCLKLITFDVTNTLLKFKIPPWQHYSKVAREYGYQGNDQVLYQRFVDRYKFMSSKYPNFGKNKIGFEEWWVQVVSYTLEDQLPKTANLMVIAQRLINEYKTAHQWDVSEGCNKLLNMLTENNFVIGVISNFDPRLHEILHNVNIKHYFKFIITSYDCGYTKPDKRIFETAMQRYGQDLRHDECLHIGDDLVKDYHGAMSAGWNALLIKEKPPSGVPCKHTVPNLEYLKTMIEENKLIL